MKKFCVNCGNTLDEGIKFCTKCGQQVLEPDSESPIIQPMNKETTFNPVQKQEIKTSKHDVLDFIKKNKIALAIGCLVIIALIFILNRNPLSGTWVAQKDDDFPGTVKIAGNNLEANISVEGNHFKLKGKLKKEEENLYSLNLLDTKISGEIKDFYDSYSSEQEFVEEVIDNIVSEIPIDETQIRQVLKGFDKKGNNLVFSVDVSKISKQAVGSLVQGVASRFTKLNITKISNNLINVTFQGQKIDLIKK